MFLTIETYKIKTGIFNFEKKLAWEWRKQKSLVGKERGEKANRC